MGQKVDPRGLRLGITRAWDSNWYADKKEYVKYFFDDKEFLESYHSLQYILNIVYLSL